MATAASIPLNVYSVAESVPEAEVNVDSLQTSAPHLEDRTSDPALLVTKYDLEFQVRLPLEGLALEDFDIRTEDDRKRPL